MNLNLRGKTSCAGLALVFIFLFSALRAEPLPAALAGVQRIVFLGDSITYAGDFVDDVKAVVRTRDPHWAGEILDLGLPSETVSGLSEPGHAGGAFPRPDLHERLDRVLAQTKPDLVVACYGMNDGIYLPYAPDRAEKFQAGLRRLREKVAAAHARLVIVTPPVFDPLPRKSRAMPDPYDAGYNTVLDRYAAWLVAQRAEGWDVIDAHGPMNAALAAERRSDAAFTYAKDGVHPNAAGHAVIARAIVTGLGFSAAEAELPVRWAAETPVNPWLKLIRTRRKLLSDAWLTATGHKRPGMAHGVPLAEATAQAAALGAQIAKGPATAP